MLAFSLKRSALCLLIPSRASKSPLPQDVKVGGADKRKDVLIPDQPYASYTDDQDLYFLVLSPRTITKDLGSVPLFSVMAQ